MNILIKNKEIIFYFYIRLLNTSYNLIQYANVEYCFLFCSKYRMNKEGNKLTLDL